MSFQAWHSLLLHKPTAPNWCVCFCVYKAKQTPIFMCFVMMGGKQCNAMTWKTMRFAFPTYTLLSPINAMSAYKSCHIKYFGICFRLWDINPVFFFSSYMFAFHCANVYFYFISFIIENRFLYDYYLYGSSNYMRAVY